MGASTIVTHTILFIAVLAISTGLLFSIKSFTDGAESSMVSNSKALQNQMNTDFSVELIYFNNDTNITSIYLVNTGTTALDPYEIDTYIDGYRFQRNETNRTIIADTEKGSTAVWERNEKLLITAKKYLKDGIHELVITTQYNGREEETFSTGD